MPQELTLYGQTITISDEYAIFNKLKNLIASEATKAASKFIDVYWSKYETIEKLLDNGYEDGMHIISEVIQNVVISQIFMKVKIYDMDINRFYQRFYNCTWGKTLQELLDRYNELSDEANSLSGQMRSIGDRYERIAKSYKHYHDASLSTGATFNEAMSTMLFGKWGMSESHRNSHEFWTNALEGERHDAKQQVSRLQDNLNQILQTQKGLYQLAKEPLQDEINSCVMMILPACIQAMSIHNVVDTNSIPILNEEKVSRANSIVNNMAHMSQNDIIEFIPDLILALPYNLDLYEKLLLRLGDQKGELVQVAKLFGVSENLVITKEQKLKELLEKLKPDFYETKESSAKARKTLITQAKLFGYPYEKFEAMLRDFVSKVRQEAARNPDTEVSSSLLFPLIIGTVIVVFALMNEAAAAAAFWGILFGIGCLFKYNKITGEKAIISQEIAKAKQLLDNWKDDYSDYSSDETDNINTIEATPDDISQPTHDEISDIPSTVNLAKSNITTEDQTNTYIPPELNNSNKLIITSPTLERNIPVPTVPTQVQEIKQYEPVLGLETDALIKRAFLFLEDGEFDNAGRYLNQALNQDPEDARIHFAQLMLIHQVHNAEELIQNLATPLNDEKLFQRALRFADDDYKTQLLGYALQSNDKLEKQRLANEAEQQRIRAEYEAEQERIKAEHEAEQKRLQAEKEAKLEKRYQEILKLKDTVSTISEFNNLLKLINSLKPYKDTDELFEKLSQARTEKIYQEILNLKSTASTITEIDNLLTLIKSIKPYKDTDELFEEISQKRDKEANYKNALYWKEQYFTYHTSIDDLKHLITTLEALEGYKDSDNLLAEAKEALRKAEANKRNKRILLAIIASGLIIAGLWFFYQKRIEYANQAFSTAQSFEARKLYNEALFQYREANRYGHSDAQNRITALETKIAKEKQEQARLAQDAFNKAKDFESVKLYNEALSRYHEAVKLGHPDAQRYLDTLESKIAKEREEAQKQEQQERERKANHFFNQAQNYERNGDDINALKFYNKAYELGHPDALEASGALMEKNTYKTIEILLQQPISEIDRTQQERKDRKDARQTQTKATVFNVTPEIQAEYSQAETFLNDKNYSQALSIFRRLANLGYAPAQDKLAWMYQNGWGVQQNYSIAVDWFRKAANQGNTEALASMGLMYYRGWGVPRNYNTALEWYTKAANQGSEVAQRRINSIQLLMFNKEIISSVERRNDFPISGAIAANSLSVREYANTKATVLKTLKTGHPISISRALESDNDYWFYIKTASGTEGWVLAAYVNLNNNRGLSYNENSNRRYSLPQQGYISTASSSDHLNLRNIPAIQGSQVIEKIDNGARITAYEIFAGDTIDWYRVRTNSGNIGWVSGKYIVLR